MGPDRGWWWVVEAKPSLLRLTAYCCATHFRARYACRRMHCCTSARVPTSRTAATGASVPCARTAATATRCPIADPTGGGY